MENFERALAAVAMALPGGAIWFFFFWSWFDFWRRRRLLAYGAFAACLGSVIALESVFDRWTYAGRLSLPTPVKVLGWVLLGVTTIFGFVADRQIGWRVRSFMPFFDRQGRIKLRTTGAYGLVRHPIYATAIWFQLGTFLVSGFPGVLVACAIWTLSALWFTRQEERRLVELLDDPTEYERYRERVPALLPSLRPH